MGWRTYGLLGVLLVQSALYGLRLFDGFYDGRRHLSWGTPFYIMKAEEMRKVPFWTAGRAGLVSRSVDTPEGRRPVEWYGSHPQFIAIPLHLWTGLFGYSEWAARSLAASASLLTAALLWFGFRERRGEREATEFTALWAALPAVIVFGRGLEHEPFVMLFVGLGFLAQEKFLAGGERWRWAWVAALVGMMWSDWPGFVFAALLCAGHFLAGRRHPPSRRLAAYAALSIALGLAVVLGQAALTQTRPDAAAAAPAPAASLGATAGGLWNQYYNRSGRGGGVPWSYWLLKQKEYWLTNFTALSLLGLGAALLAAWRRRAEGLGAGAYFAAVALGTLIYAAIVREATAVHLFYQYFYGGLAAWGLFELVLRAGSVPGLRAAAWAVLLALLASSGIRTLYLPEQLGPGEVALLKLIKPYPAGARASMIASPEDNYLANPGAEYYAGRRIWMAYPEDAAAGDLVLVPAGDVGAQQAALDALTGPRGRFSLKACSELLCLWAKS